MLSFNGVQYINYPYCVVAVLYTDTCSMWIIQKKQTILILTRLMLVNHFFFQVWFILPTLHVPQHCGCNLAKVLRLLLGKNNLRFLELSCNIFRKKSQCYEIILLWKGSYYITRIVLILLLQRRVLIFWEKI